jgi:hypothetical protein
MSEVELLSAPKFRRGQRFDWLYEHIVTSGRLESVLSKNGSVQKVLQKKEVMVRGWISKPQPRIEP